MSKKLQRIEITSIEDVNAVLDHSIAGVPHRINGSSLELPLKVPVCEVAIPGTLANSWRYAFCDLTLVFRGVSNFSNRVIETEKDAGFEVWDGEDILMHIFTDAHFQMDCYTARISFDYDAVTIE